MSLGATFAATLLAGCRSHDLTVPNCIVKDIVSPALLWIALDPSNLPWSKSLWISCSISFASGNSMGQIIATAIMNSNFLKIGLSMRNGASSDTLLAKREIPIRHSCMDIELGDGQFSFAFFTNL
jgi:hypothetical protein